MTPLQPRTNIKLNVYGPKRSYPFHYHTAASYIHLYDVVNGRFSTMSAKLAVVCLMVCRVLNITESHFPKDINVHNAIKVYLRVVYPHVCTLFAEVICEESRMKPWKKK
jgi:hypothetical protein